LDASHSPPISLFHFPEEARLRKHNFARLMELFAQRPDVFVLPGPAPEAEFLVKPLLARLRAAGRHARASSKTTRNVGKLLKDANDQGARVAMIIESKETVALKDLATGEQSQPMLVAEAFARLGIRL